ncbi:MAG: ABC transporter permease subunit [Methylococcales bacterium]|nr:ABC transporter permease subunit [Methylococcales bacterium]
MMLTIACRELKTLFLSPLAWVLLAVVQIIQAYLFLTLVEAFNGVQSSLANMSDSPGLADLVVTPLFYNTAVILLLIIPLLTMRMICEERRNKTLALLLSAPISNVHIIGGKFLAVLGLLSLTILLASLMSLSLTIGATLDFGKFFANILALSLLAAAFTAIGLWLSCVASQPTVAAISTFGCLLLLWMLDWSNSFRDQSSSTLHYLSISRHFQTLQSGLMSTVDISYFVLFIITFLTLSVRRLEQDRLQK